MKHKSHQLCLETKACCYSGCLRQVVQWLAIRWVLKALKSCSCAASKSEDPRPCPSTACYQVALKLQRLLIRSLRVISDLKATGSNMSPRLTRQQVHWYWPLTCWIVSIWRRAPACPQSLTSPLVCLWDGLRSGSSMAYADSAEKQGRWRRLPWAWTQTPSRAMAYKARTGLVWETTWSLRTACNRSFSALLPALCASIATIKFFSKKGRAATSSSNIQYGKLGIHPIIPNDYPISTWTCSQNNKFVQNTFFPFTPKHHL